MTMEHTPQPYIEEQLEDPGLVRKRYYLIFSDRSRDEIGYLQIG
jgi:hypothetical protein